MAKSKRTKAHTRYYVEDGDTKTLVPGVTTVLNILSKPALVPWANKLGLKGIEVGKYVDDLADIGTLGHAFVTDGLMGQETDTSDFTPNQVDSAQNSVLSWLAWEAEHPVEKTFWVEKPLVSTIHRYGGTADIYCQIGGRSELIDLKTGRGIYEEAVYQVATLKTLLEENGYPVDVCRILNIPRSEDEGFLEKVLTPKELDTGRKIFQNCLNIYYLKKEGKGK